MNKILKLFDEQFVVDLFTKQVLPEYSGFTKVLSVEIIPIKKNVWQTTYHVVLEFKTVFLTKDGRKKTLPLFCTAHSGEPRIKSYQALKFLWENGFNRGNLTLPHPLFFSPYFNGFFYRGVKGHNLYHYLRQENHEEIEKIIPKAAAWLTKLHSLPIAKAKNFNKENSRIPTVFPGIKIILEKVEKNFNEYYPVYSNIYSFLISEEKKFLSKNKKLCLIHGDAHPENVIKISSKKTAVIDFTDICLADFARDLGSFLQQLEFMAQRKITDYSYIEKIKKLFLDSYLDLAKVELDQSLADRIKIYYNWTALRTTTIFVLKENPEPERARGLLERISQDLNLTN